MLHEGDEMIFENILLSDIVAPPVTVNISKMIAEKIYDKEIANPITTNEKSKVDGTVNTSTSNKVDQSSEKTVTSVNQMENNKNNNSLPSSSSITKEVSSIQDSTNLDNEIDPLSSGDERKSGQPKRKRKRKQREPIKSLKPADPDSDSSVSTTIGDTGESEEGSTFNLVQPECSSESSDAESDATTDCHNRSVSEFDLMRDKWDGYIFQSDSDEENNLIEKEKRVAEYKKLDMGKVNALCVQRSTHLVPVRGSLCLSTRSGLDIIASLDNIYIGTDINIDSSDEI